MIVVWATLNALLSGGLAAILAYKLTVWHNSFNVHERIGMGLMGGSVILTVAPLLAPGPSPFDGWATALLRLGAIIYFAGRLQRHRKHYKANQAAKRSALLFREGKAR